MGIEDLFLSVEEESREPIAAEVIGTLPQWLEGSFYRNGPGKFEFGDTQYNHWFDGMALLHRFKVSNGSVTYQNRFLESDTYLKNLNANRIIVSEFGTLAHPDPCKNIFQRIASHFKLGSTDNTSVNCFPVGDALYACTESNFINKVDRETLERVGQVDLTKIVSVNSATAHPHLDPDGTVHNLGSIHGMRSNYAFIKITPPKSGEGSFCEKAEVVAKIPAQLKLKPSYFHSFAMTENYYILLEQPLVVNVKDIATAKLRGVAFNTAIEWHPQMSVKFHIIDKKTGQKVNEDVAYLGEAFFTFHHANAYEEDGGIILDTVAWGKEANIDKLIKGMLSLSDLQKGKRDAGDTLGGMPFLRRFFLPVSFERSSKGTNLTPIERTTAEAVFSDGKDKHDGKIKFLMQCKYETITDVPMEFPQVNYSRVNTKKYSFVYGIGAGGEGARDCLIKIDVASKTVLKWQEENVFPSEPIFVASPDGAEEDDGILLSVGLTTGANRCAYLLVLNARDMTEMGRARVDVKIGMGFHGLFLADANNY